MTKLIRFLDVVAFVPQCFVVVIAEPGITSAISRTGVLFVGLYADAVDNVEMCKSRTLSDQRLFI